MLTIGICDDEKSVCANLEYALKELSNDNLTDVEIEVFYSGEDLIDFISKGGYFDIILLDIALEKIDGIEVGRIIRNEMKNEVTQIVYISRRKDYAMALFEVRPFDFILKPIDREELKRVFKTALRLIKKSNLSFQFNIGNTTINRLMKDILYFESNNRKIKIVTIDGAESFYGKMDDVLIQTQRHDFLYIHKSYLINYNHASAITYTQVTMSDGTVLPISQKRRKEIRDLQLRIGRREK